MRNTELIANKEVKTERNEDMILKYYLVEEHKGYKTSSLVYGIKLVKMMEDKSEIEIIESISHSKEMVIQIIDKLADNDVTPLTVVEIVDDIMTEVTWIDEDISHTA